MVAAPFGPGGRFGEHERAFFPLGQDAFYLGQGLEQARRFDRFDQVVGNVQLEAFDGVFPVRSRDHGQRRVFHRTDIVQPVASREYHFDEQHIGGQAAYGKGYVLRRVVHPGDTELFVAGQFAREGFARRGVGIDDQAAYHFVWRCFRWDMLRTMAALSSKPTNRRKAMMNSQNMKMSTAPIEPYSLLYCEKWLM